MIRTFAAALATTTCIVALATPAAAQTREFNIPAGSLRSALDAFARQSGRQVIYRGDEVRSARSPGVRGARTAEDALDAILAGTGFTAKKDFSGAFAVAKVGNAPAAVKKAASLGDESESQAEIVVTGTNIRGAPPSSSLVVVDRADIERSGYATTGEVMRSLPQNFGGGQNPGVVGARGNDQGSISGASSPNLRGLGASSTLTLINGHRLAYDGYRNGVDISAIPLAAVQRVEVLTDGASAIYGSDAVAGVVNFILRKDFTGFETSGRLGTATRGGTSELSVNQLAGFAGSAGNILVDYEHYFQGALYASDRRFSAGADAPTTLLPQQRRDSIFASGNLRLSSNVGLFADGIYTNRRTIITSTQFGSTSDNDVTVNQYGLTVGSNIDFSDDWRLTATGTISRSHDEQDFTTRTSTTTTTSSAPTTNLLKLGSLGLEGSLFRLPAGPVRIAAGGEVRRETLRSVSGSIPIDGGRTISAAYGEFRVPLVSPTTASPGLYRLEVSGALRYEHYTSFGSATSPKLSVLYAPAPALSFTASWGRAFRAPTLLEASGPQQVFVLPNAFLGSAAPAGAQYLFTGGSNPDLSPERAETLSVGALFSTPDNRFRASLNYYDIRYRGRIFTPVSNLGSVLTDPSRSEFVFPNPSAADQASLINNAALFLDFTGGQYDPARVAAIIVSSYQNTAQQNVSGLDAAASYAIPIARSELELFGNLAYLYFTQRVTGNSPLEKISGTVFNNPTFRGRGGMTWSQGGFSATTIVNYIDGKLDNASTPFVEINPWTTFDLTLQWNPPARGVFGGLTFDLSVQNLFDRSPPFVRSASTNLSAIGFDTTSYSALGRFVSFSIRKRW